MSRRATRDLQVVAGYGFVAGVDHDVERRHPPPAAQQIPPLRGVRHRLPLTGAGQHQDRTGHGIDVPVGVPGKLHRQLGVQEGRQRRARDPVLPDAPRQRRDRHLGARPARKPTQTIISGPGSGFGRRFHPN